MWALCTLPLSEAEENLRRRLQPSRCTRNQICCKMGAIQKAELQTSLKDLTILCTPVNNTIEKGSRMGSLPEYGKTSLTNVYIYCIYCISSAVKILYLYKNMGSLWYLTLYTTKYQVSSCLASVGGRSIMETHLAFNLLSPKAVWIYSYETWYYYIASHILTQHVYAPSLL